MSTQWPPPVQIEPPDDEDGDGIDAEDLAMRQAASAAGRVAVSFGLLSAAVTIVAMFFLRSALQSADVFLQPGSSYGFAAFTPAGLLALVGLVTGGALAQRVASATGLTGPVVVMLSLVSAMGLCAATGCAAWAMFNGGVPTMAWVGIAATAVAHVIGAVGVNQVLG